MPVRRKYACLLDVGLQPIADQIGDLTAVSLLHHGVGIAADPHFREMHPCTVPAELVDARVQPTHGALIGEIPYPAVVRRAVFFTKEVTPDEEEGDILEGGHVAHIRPWQMVKMMQEIKMPRLRTLWLS